MLNEEALAEASVDLACRRELEVGGIGEPGRDIQVFYQKLGLNTPSLEDCFPQRVTF